MIKITNESRAFQGPWTTLVKGRGLGSNVKKYDAREAEGVIKILDLMDKEKVGSKPYHIFSKELCLFILDFNNPNVLFFQRKELHPRVDKLIGALKKIDDCYQYISASSILFECFGKLGLDPHLWINKHIDLAESALEKLQHLPHSNEQQCYTALQVYGNLFLGIAHIGFVDKLTHGDKDYVQQAFDVASGLKSVWYKGRGMSAFLTVLGMVGLGHYVTEGSQNYLKELVAYMDASLCDKERVDKHLNEYVFASVLMINCAGVLNETKYLEYKRDWVCVSAAMIEKLPLNLRMIFSHYFLSTLNNMGLTHPLTDNPQSYLYEMAKKIICSEESELDFMAYTYCVDIANKLNKKEAIPNLIPQAIINNISTLYDFELDDKPKNVFYRSGFMRIAYALLAMSQMGKVDFLLANRCENNTCLIERIIHNHSNNWHEDDDSFTVLDHALIDLSLSQRGIDEESSFVDKNTVIQRVAVRPVMEFPSRTEKIALHAYFPGMNSRRFYKNLSRELYEKGNAKVRAIFDISAEIIAQQNKEKKDVSRFFFEKTLPQDDVYKKWNHIGSAMTVYNLALFEHLKSSSSDFLISSAGGESYGMIAAAIVSNALSLEDGLKVANSTLGIMYQYAHSNNLGAWNIVSLSGSSVKEDLSEIINAFSGLIDIFRWQTLTNEREEVHVYVRSNIVNELKQFIEDNYLNKIHFNEFKKPTIEIVHSPKLKPARIDVSNYMIDSNIKFSQPDIPLVSNNGIGIASTKADVRSCVLDMVNIPMYSAQSFQQDASGIPINTNAIVEFGYGQKTRPFIFEHNIRQPFYEYFGGVDALSSIANKIKSGGKRQKLMPTFDGKNKSVSEYNFA